MQKRTIDALVLLQIVFNEYFYVHDPHAPRNDIDALVSQKSNSNLHFLQDQRFGPKHAKPCNQGFGLIPNRFLMKPSMNMIITPRGPALMLGFQKKKN